MTVWVRREGTGRTQAGPTLGDGRTGSLTTPSASQPSTSQSETFCRPTLKQRRVSENTGTDSLPPTPYLSGSLRVTWGGRIGLRSHTAGKKYSKYIETNVFTEKCFLLTMISLTGSRLPFVLMYFYCIKQYP